MAKSQKEGAAIRVAITGARGRMGSLACASLASDPDCAIVAKLGRDDSLRDALALHRPDVVLDLTNAHAARSNAQTIIESGCRAVIGTSGLLDSDLDALRQLVHAQNGGALVVPNFSVSAALL